jgi:signal transduction histidine kinase
MRGLRRARQKPEPIVTNTKGTRSGAPLLARDDERAQHVEATIDGCNGEALSARLRDGQRLEQLGLCATGLAHDLRNFLMVILGHASSRVADSAASAALRESLCQIMFAAERADGLCGQLLSYASDTRPKSVPLDLTHLVGETVQLFRGSVTRYASLVLDLDERLPAVIGDPVQLQQVIANLMLNAAHATEEPAGVVTVRTRMAALEPWMLRSLRIGTDLTPGSYVLLEVTDTGKGMTPALLERVFEPFFTTKESGRGLGLAIVRDIVQAHRAGLRVLSTPTVGTSFHVLFSPFIDV